MDENANYAGLVELALTFALAIAFGIHQMLDLRREKRRRAAERSPERD
jgi:hypothetical protein